MHPLIVSLLSSSPFSRTITFMLMMLNCSFHFINLTMTQALLTYRISL